MSLTQSFFHKMKIFAPCLAILFFLASFKPTLTGPVAQCYDPDYVEISSVKHKNSTFKMVLMQREGERVKAKYFAAKDESGNSVFHRYEEWKKQYSGIILMSSGTYMDHQVKPEGLTIDNGVPVNETLIQDKMDALVIVYATGGIVVSDLKAADLSVSGGGIDKNRRFNLRRSSKDLEDFITWAKGQEATVFQTHLLVYKNELKLGTNSKPTPRERRFLAVGKDPQGKVVHVIVHSPEQLSLSDGSQKVLEFLNFKEINVTFMINLDTGYQDVFELHNSNCTINSTIKGQQSPNVAVNLLAYYFQ